MPIIICLEGPSAVGKSTAGGGLKRAAGAAVVEEVNKLFVRPDPEPPDWYLERQVERWARAQDLLSGHPVVVLDGDPFQPLWYDWSCGSVGRQPSPALRAFYREQIRRGRLRFPDGYVLFEIDEPALRQRKASDASRSRRNFEKHLRLVDALPRYFRALGALAPGLVRPLDATATADGVLGALLDACSSFEPRSGEGDLPLFDAITEWLDAHASP